MWDADSIASFLTKELKNYTFTHRRGARFHFSVPRNRDQARMRKNGAHTEWKT